jgi:hypothetical protein
VLRRISGPARGEVMGGRRQLNNVELHNLNSSDVIKITKSRRMKWMGHVESTSEIRNACLVLVGKKNRKEEIILKT